MTGRTPIYDCLELLINEKPVFGWGYGNTAVMALVGYGNAQNGIAELMVNYGAFGVLADKNATCYPGCEDQLMAKRHSTEPVVVDGNVITSRGVGTAIEFALKLVEILIDRQTADDLAEKIVYKR